MHGVRIAALAGSLAAIASTSAVAHPHVFVDYAVTLVVVGERLTGVRLTWTFDDLFSGFILQEFDKDRNGVFSTSELQQIEAKHLSEFKRVGYYTTINLNGNAGHGAGCSRVPGDGRQGSRDLRVHVAPRRIARVDDGD